MINQGHFQNKMFFLVKNDISSIVKNVFYFISNLDTKTVFLSGCDIMNICCENTFLHSLSSLYENLK